MVVGVVVATFGTAVLVVWWLSWRGRWVFRPDAPRAMRFLLLPAPGVGLVAIAGAAAGVGDGLALDGLVRGAGVLAFAGLAVVVLGLGCALFALVRPLPRRLDVEWLVPRTRARAEAMRRWRRANTGDRRRRRRRLWVGAVLVGSAAIGLGMTLGGEIRGLAAVLAGCLGLLYQWLSSRPPTQRFPHPKVRTVAGVAPEPGVAFRIDRSGEVAATAAAALFFVVGGALVVIYGWFAWDLLDPWWQVIFLVEPVAIGVLSAALGGVGLVAAVPLVAAPTWLVLTPHRIAVRHQRTRLSIRWEDIESVSLGGSRSRPTLGIRAVDAHRFDLGGPRRRYPWRPRRRPPARAYRVIPLRPVLADPALVVAAVEHFLNNRDDRARLGDPGIVDVLYSLEVRAE